MDAKMATLEHSVMILVKRATTVSSVLSTALKIVKPVDTQTAFALVRRGGWDTIVPQGVHRDIMDWTARITVAGTV